MAESDPVSCVDTSRDKVTLVVDGMPFFYNGAQASPHRLMDRDGWTWDDLDRVFLAAAESELTVLGIPIRWNRIEPAPWQFNWTDVDRALDLGAKHDLKLEFIWFGSQICSLSEERLGTPTFLFADAEFVIDENGSEIAVQGKDQILGRPTVYRKLDIADPLLLQREAEALSQTLSHVRRYLSEHELPNVLIGIDVLNEPTSAALWAESQGTARSHSLSAEAAWLQGEFADATSFNTSLMWRYLNGLARAVKLSEYPVWTRVNFNVTLEGPDQMESLLQLAEVERAKGHSYLDFIGADPYTSDIDAIFQYGANSMFRSGRNLVMVMENGGQYENSDQLLFNALASDGVYHVWEVCDSMPDFPAGLYEVVAGRRELRPKRHHERVRRLNAMLRRNAFDLATLRAGGDALRFFNRRFAAVQESHESLGPLRITFRTAASAAGIASTSGNDLVLMSTAPATFDILTNKTVRAAQRGSFDTHRVWSTDAEVSVAISPGQVVVSTRDYDCVRILLN